MSVLEVVAIVIAAAVCAGMFELVLWLESDEEKKK